MNLRSLGLPLLAATSLLTFAAARPAAATTTPVAVQGPGGGQGCNQGTLHGRHGFSYDGVILGVGPIAACGPITFDGHGHLSASYSTSVNGTTFRGSFVGTYVVQPDGSGSVTLTLPLLGLQAHGDFVLVDDGRGTFFSCSDAGFSITGSTRRQ